MTASKNAEICNIDFIVGSGYIHLFPFKVWRQSINIAADVI